MEEIASDGIWISLWPISEEIADFGFQFSSGDVLLLFTDDITEAIKDAIFNAMEGLCVSSQ